MVRIPRLDFGPWILAASSARRIAQRCSSESALSRRKISLWRSIFLSPTCIVYIRGVFNDVPCSSCPCVYFRQHFFAVRRSQKNRSKRREAGCVPSADTYVYTSTHIGDFFFATAFHTPVSSCCCSIALKAAQYCGYIKWRCFFFLYFC